MVNLGWDLYCERLPWNQTFYLITDIPKGAQTHTNTHKYTHLPNMHSGLVFYMTGKDAHKLKGIEIH